MKLGDVLRKERERKKLTIEAVATRLALSVPEYLLLEAGDSPAEEWGPLLAHIAIALEVPTSRLLAQSGKSADTRLGRSSATIASGG
jgi:transcriptional regulator with XRE-family HTH domain